MLSIASGGKNYENQIMFAQVTAKNVKDDFFETSVLCLLPSKRQL